MSNSVRKDIAHILPDNVNLTKGLVCESACVAYNPTFEKSHLKLADSVVIIGPGPVGIICTQLARLCTPFGLVIVGLSSGKNRLNVAKSL